MKIIRMPMPYFSLKEYSSLITKFYLHEIAILLTSQKLDSDNTVLIEINTIDTIDAV